MRVLDAEPGPVLDSLYAEADNIEQIYDIRTVRNENCEAMWYHDRLKTLGLDADANQSGEREGHLAQKQDQDSAKGGRLKFTSIEGSVDRSGNDESGVSLDKCSSGTDSLAHSRFAVECDEPIWPPELDIVDNFETSHLEQNYGSVITVSPLL